MEPSAAEAGGESPATFKVGADALVAGLLLLVGVVIFLWYAPHSYDIYLAGHVIAITVWVGGDITLTTLGIVFERKQDAGALAELGKMGTWIGTRVYTPALFVAFAFGVALIEKSGGAWPWDAFWVIFGIVGWSIAMLVGIGFVGPELGRIDKAARELGPGSPEVARRVRRLFFIFRFDSALLALIVIDMVAKPDF
jgi:hypothetical protein